MGGKIGICNKDLRFCCEGWIIWFLFLNIFLVNIMIVCMIVLFVVEMESFICGCICLLFGLISSDVCSCVLVGIMFNCDWFIFWFLIFFI